jgi:carbon-monoxide dehydrogenase large subunit
MEPSLDSDAVFDPENFSFPHGTHLACVEVDTETGRVHLRKYVCVDDVGNVINPLLVEGQVHGGLAQGIGQALTENCSYDDTGQLVTGSLTDYCIPRASDLPLFKIDTRETPCTHNPLGVKGCGEAGAIGAPAAVMNAITDALGVKDLSMPATAQNVWRAMHRA